MIALAAVIPPHAAECVAHAAPAAEYVDAVSRAVRQQRADDRVAAPGSRTVLLTHGGRTARVVVLCHGVSESPRPYEHISERLYGSGDTVYVPRLPHHAARNGTARTLTGLTAEELRQCAESAIDIAHGLRRWSGGGASVTAYECPRSLHLPHDIAEEAHPNANPAVVYPAREAVIHGERPLPVLSGHRLWPP
jgi:hypothetical protein